ncbi:hypothetical protein AB0L25_27155 [Spirillospora sp. NPDC052242]
MLHEIGALRAAMTEPGEPGWKTCLLQVTRAGMGLSVDFEYDDEERWKVGPGDLERMVETLRPG